MTAKPDFDTDRMTVAEFCDRSLCGEPTAIPRAASFHEVVVAFRRNPVCRTLAVLDDAGVVTGIIPAELLYDALFVEVFPSAALGEIDDLDSAFEVMQGMRHRTAGELMEDPVVLRLGDTIREAFIAIHRAQQSGLPIVDVADRLTGYLDLESLAALWSDRAAEPPASP